MLNLFYFNIPRLSVDIDLNYQGVDRSAMLEKRADHEEIFRQLFQKKGYRIKRMPEEHASGKLRLSYKNFMDQEQNLEIDVNYMLRVPVAALELRDSHE